MDYEVLEHTADLKIRAYGKTLSELFSNMVKGMFESCQPMIDNESEPIIRQIEISTKSELSLNGKPENLESLLINFLNEALYFSDVNNEVYFRAEFDTLTETELKGRLVGNKIKKMGKEIKAVTWHELEIKKVNNKWQATVLFDI